ncbi:MAG TPA: SsrA-binding protein SmpB [Myxococcota bacterium]|nr:SsrA-binding protein SmpB [Myxococcota bacterium]HRY95969.1 SsrA-binding protein SmpB [Myxococcota bacterium]HSA22965.1 SsrA-binding protein SmpB [Myxococcota bacterium]
MGKARDAQAEAGRKVVCRNRKAAHDYFIEERLEAGLVLTGSEVKSLREGKASLQEAFAVLERGEAWLLGVHIQEWVNAKFFGHAPTRKRKLLLHKRQLRKLQGQMQEKGYTLVALSIYFNERNRAKVELGLARGKRQFDKRATIREREQRREAEREAH